MDCLPPHNYVFFVCNASPCVMRVFLPDEFVRTCPANDVIMVPEELCTGVDATITTETQSYGLFKTKTRTIRVRQYVSIPFGPGNNWPYLIDYRNLFKSPGTTSRDAIVIIRKKAQASDWNDIDTGMSDVAMIGEPCAHNRKLEGKSPCPSTMDVVKHWYDDVHKPCTGAKTLHDLRTILGDDIVDWCLTDSTASMSICHVSYAGEFENGGIHTLRIHCKDQDDVNMQINASMTLTMSGHDDTTPIAIADAYESTALASAHRLARHEQCDDDASMERKMDA